MAGLQAIQGVDDTLRELAKRAVQPLTPKPRITVGHLDSDADDLRLNWFLYRVSPNAAYRNMEPPQTGWHTARGRPPLAVKLSYLLTAFPAKANGDGDQEQFAHAGMAAVMRELHEHSILGEGEPAVSGLAKPLVEPLRIAMEDLDVEAITKLWSAAAVPLRLSVGYEVSLVTVDPEDEYVAGPPVRTRRVAVAPSLGPRMSSVAPARAWAGIDISVAVDDLTSGTVFTLAREDGDPPHPTDWAMSVESDPPPGTVVLQLPDPGLAPGARRLDAVASESGLVVGHDSIALTVVPVVTGPATPLVRGTPVSLDMVHAAADIEVFIGGVRIPGAAFVSPTEVRITIPTTTPPGPAEVLVRAGKVAGPPASIEVSP